METKVNFIVTKEERKALVKAIGEFTGWVPVYKGAPSFAFAVNNYIIDRDGSLIYDERTDEQEAQRLIEHLSAQGFVCEAGDKSPHTAAHEQSVDLPEDSSPAVISDSNAPDKKPIIIDMPFFNETALDNLRKLISGKAALIKKAIGVEDLAVAVIGGAVHFNWFNPDSIESELEAYKQFVSALCVTAKNQKRVTMKESAVESEKFAFRCFLLKLGFIGQEFASARKVLLAKLSGSGSFKSGDHKNRGVRNNSATIHSDEENAEYSGNRGSSSGEDTVVPERCGDCCHHCYYTEGLLCTSDGNAVDTSARIPEKYTHYCLKAPSGFRRLKHAVDWSGGETPPQWCPIKNAVSAANSEVTEEVSVS